MIYALEGLRGIAALLVALFHAWECAVTANPLVRNSWLFVDLFFVISGYVMSHVYSNRMENLVDFQTFVIKRVGRLYPLHLVSLCLFIAAAFALQFVKSAGTHFGHPLGSEPANFHIVETSSLLYNLAMLHGVGLPGERTYNVPSWSVSSEIWAYLLFAVGVLALRRQQQRVLLWTLLASGGLALWIASPNAHPAAGLFRCAYGFFLGAALPHLKTKLAVPRALLNAVQLAAFASTAALIWKVGAVPWLKFITPLAFAAVVVSVSGDTGTATRVLHCRAAQYLGRISYSVYMLHWVVLVFLNHVAAVLAEPGRSILVALYVAVVVALAAVSYRLVELPWRERFRLLADAMNQRPAFERQKALGK